MTEALTVMIAGAAGTLCRWGVGRWARHALGAGFPFGTLIVNVVGCLLFGFLMQLAVNGVAMPRAVRTGITVGFLGAFTTFSTFGYETFDLLRQGAWLHAALNGSANLVLGLLAVWGGISAARLVFSG